MLLRTSMFPVTIDLSPGDMLIIEEVGEVLTSLGFDLRPLDKGTISVDAIPADSYNSDPELMVKNIIESYRSSDGNSELTDPERAAASLANASAINHGTELTMKEMESMFDALFACKNPNYSPSGKPVLSIIANDEFEKKLES